MVIAYVVLDGFDLGAGIISLFVARTHDERHLILRAIGPVWDGNEVWLVAAAGALFFAFPPLYAASFSGFYLPLMIVLWLLMLRGIGVELRSHVDDPLWWSFFDFVFSFSSVLLAIFFGAAVGNVVRGVPLGADGYFFEALWTDFQVGPHPGILDWYTVVIGLLAVAALTVHGANYVALKTEGDLRARTSGSQPSLVAACDPDRVELGRESVYPAARHQQFYFASLGMADSGDGSGLFNCAAALPRAKKGPSRICRVERLYYRHSWWGGLRALPCPTPCKHGSAL